jgi:hypothetical protein
MILSDSFLTNTYYRHFREFLLARLRIDELLLAPWKLFHGRAADVRTCILTGRREEHTDDPARPGLRRHRIRLIDRVNTEADYARPPRVEHIAQSEIAAYPDHAFLIGVPKPLRTLYLEPPMRLGDVVTGGTGISTGNDRRFLRRRAEVAGDPAWVPYYKNGARQPFWYEPEFCIERDYAPNRRLAPNFLVRNAACFFREGVTCSSVGVRFSAAYLPPDALFGVNANFFFGDRVSLFYTLGLLNTSLAWYFARRVLIRSNNISANYLRRLPYVEPPPALKRDIAATVEALVGELRAGFHPDLPAVRARLDDLTFDLYGCSRRVRIEVRDFCDHFYARL